MNEWIKSILYILLVSVFVDIISSTLVLRKFIKLVMSMIVMTVMIRPIYKICKFDHIKEIDEMLMKLNSFYKDYEDKYEKYNPKETYLKYVISSYEDSLKYEVEKLLLNSGYEILDFKIKFSKDLEEINEIKMTIRKEENFDKNKQSNLDKATDIDKIKYKVYMNKFDEIKLKEEIEKMIQIKEDKISIYIIE